MMARNVSCSGDSYTGTEDMETRRGYGVIAAVHLNRFDSLEACKRSTVGSEDSIQRSADQTSLHRKNSSGFLSVFKWLQKRENQQSNDGSNKSISTSAGNISKSSSLSFLPLVRSKSSESPKAGSIFRRFNIFSLRKNNVKNNNERNSFVSTNSDLSRQTTPSMGGVRRKRPAPHPPSAVAMRSPSSSTFSEASFGATNSTVTEDLKVRIKRRAPVPPHLVTELSLEVSDKGPLLPLKQSQRPVSSISSSSCSQSSTLVSIKSRSSVSDSLCSLNSVRQSAENSSKVVPSKVMPSPKPWYKRRRKSQNKEPQKQYKKNHTVDNGMPEIQYSRGKIVVGSDSTDCIANKNNNKNCIEIKNEKRKSRLSLLANISELDREATKNLQQENENKRIYNENGAVRQHLLTQSDVTGTNSIDDDKVYSIESYTEQSTFTLNNKLGDSNNKLTYGKINAHPSDKISKTDAESRDFRLCINEKQDSQMIFDPELFYKLAKESPVRNVSGLNIMEEERKKFMFRKDSSLSPDNDSKHKSFGFRINNLFSPDVSTILEASESVTSSATTPGDDLDQCISTSLFDKKSLYQDIESTVTEFENSRLTTSEVREIMKEIADVQEVIERINREEEEEAKNKERINKIKKIREDILMSRERDNFEAWNMAVTKMKESLSITTDAVKPPGTRVSKWTCSACTLINLPWRLQCEACLTHRPEESESMDTLSDGIEAITSRESESSGSTAVTMVPDNTLQDRSNNTEDQNQFEFASSKRSVQEKSRICWENELQVYFKVFDNQFQQENRNRNELEEGVYAKINPTNKNKDAKISSAKIKRQQFFGTASPDSLAGIFIPESRKSQKNTKKTSQKVDSKGNTLGSDGENQLNVDQIREARLKKFVNLCNGDSKSGFPNSDTDNEGNFNMTNASVMPSIVTSHDKGIITPYNERNLLDVPLDINGEEKERANIASTVSLQSASDEKKFYKNEYRRKLELKPKGVVKNAVTVFNQMDQLNQSLRNKPARHNSHYRKSIGIIADHAQKFEKIIQESNFESTKDTPKSPVDNFAECEVDVSAAISKFDYMSAVAEVENLSPSTMSPKIRRKSEVRKKSAKITGNGKEIPENCNYCIQSNIENKICRENINNISEIDKNCSTTKPTSETIYENGFRFSNSQESFIQDGMLYANGPQSECLFSIGSGAFELIQSNEFETIEAEHSSVYPLANQDGLQVEILESDGELNNSRPKISSLQKETEFCAENNGISYGIINDCYSIDNKNEIESISQQLSNVKGIASFKADLVADDMGLYKTNTMNINRLLRSLENAIEKGNHSYAAKLAHDLALLKVSCSVVKHPKTTDNHEEVPPEEYYESVNGSNDANPEMNSEATQIKERPSLVSEERWPEQKSVYTRDNIIHPSRRAVKSDIAIGGQLPDLEPKSLQVKMYIEDRASHQGPINLDITTNLTVGELKNKVKQDYGFPLGVQRWILGRRLADDDSQSLGFYKVTVEGCPIFLYLVAPKNTASEVSTKKSGNDEAKVVSVECRDANSVHSEEEKNKLLIDKTQASADGCSLFANSNKEKYKDKKNIKVIKNKALLGESTEEDYRKIVSLVNTDANVSHNADDYNQNDNNNTSNAKQRDYSSISTTSKVKQPDHSSISTTSKVKPDDSSISVTCALTKTLVTNVQSKGNTTFSGDESPNQSEKNRKKFNAHTDLPQTPLNVHPSLKLPPDPPRRKYLPFQLNICTPLLQNESSEVIPQCDKQEDWTCPKCTLVNPFSRPGCEACATDKPDESSSCSKGSSLQVVASALESRGLVPNSEGFECAICFTGVAIGQGVVLRECLHMFCRECLANAVRYSESADAKCPFRDKNYSCAASLLEREIKELLRPMEFEKHIRKSVSQAAGSMNNVFYCKTPDCRGFCQYEDNVNVFHCDVCGKSNCLTCQAQHERRTCREYQNFIALQKDEASVKTKKFFDDLIRRGDGLPCPQCSVMLLRKWGCDWMRCPMCKTEICWVTGGPRWGPGGQGDVSGGCKCGINGRKCHPKCTYCH